MRAIAVFHRPGTSEGVELVQNHVEKLARLAGIQTTFIFIDDFLSLNVEQGTPVLAYIVTRGGHFYEIARKCGSDGLWLAAKIPLSLVASTVAAAARDCSRVELVYTPARRLREVQMKDVDYLVRAVSELTGAEVEAIPSIDSGRPGACLAFLSVSPSRRLREAEARGLNVVYRSVLLEAEDRLLGYMASALRKASAMRASRRL
jgi:hypothetical protein